MTIKSLSSQDNLLHHVTSCPSHYQSYLVGRAITTSNKDVLVSTHQHALLMVQYLIVVVQLVHLLLTTPKISCK